MGNTNGKRSKNIANLSSAQPPAGMPHPSELDLEDIEAPDDVFVHTANR